MGYDLICVENASGMSVDIRRMRWAAIKVPHSGVYFGLIIKA